MFYEKALIVNILSCFLNTCVRGDLALQKGGNIFVKRIYHLIRIYLSQFCFNVGGGGGGQFFYYVVSFVKRCALHGKLNFIAYSLSSYTLLSKIKSFCQATTDYFSKYYQFITPAHVSI